MRFKIPFTNYEVGITKRGMNFVNPSGQLVGFTEWLGNSIFTPTTPIMEEVYSTIANEFAKIDLVHVISKENEYRRKFTNQKYQTDLHKIE